MAPVSTVVDGSVFTFPSGWQITKIDEWPEQKKLTSPPFHSKGCDLIAMDGDVLWLIEAKDYTYPGASAPDDLAEVVGVKAFHSLAVLHAVARWGSAPNQQFSEKALQCREARICLAVELPDGGRKLMALATPLAALSLKLRKITRRMNVHRPIVSNSHQPNGVPWTISRDPATRGRHLDR